MLDDESVARVYCYLALLQAAELVVRVVVSEGLKGCLDSLLAVNYLWGLCYEPCGATRWLKWIKVRLKVVGYMECQRCLWLWWRRNGDEPIISVLCHASKPLRDSVVVRGSPCLKC